MDTKAAFDREAFAKEHGMTMEFVNWFFDKKAAGCGQVWFMMAAAMWEGWKESRAAIEIPSSSDSEYWFEGTFQRMRYERDVEKAITSNGIRIKGKTS